MTSTLRKRDLKRCCAEGSSRAVRARHQAQKRRPRHPAFKRNDGAVADVGGVTVKGEESESRLATRDPPRVELDTVRGRDPNVFHIQTTRMPLAVEAPGIVREEDQAQLEHADECQDQEIGDNNGEKQAQKTMVERFS